MLLKRRILSAAVSLAFAATILPVAGNAVAANAIESIVTPYQPTIHETIDASGFKHPGVGLTKEILENMRAGVRAQKEPWNTYFNATASSFAASKTIGPAYSAGAYNSQSFNSKFITDGLRAYTQAIMYYVTGDEVYRSNCMRILRLWMQMDPSSYAYFNDAHIHTGIPFNRMVAAAEIMRYTSTQTPALEWTEQDTASFTTKLITPSIETFMHTNYRFMNQHLYPLIGAMSGYIFTGNRERYNEGVEWITVNKTAVDQGQNGALKQLFRLVEKNDVTGEAVEPVVQHVEMGRDQAHGAGDVTNFGILARLLLAQDTKVDPVEGTASTAPNAVGPYEFLNDRILDGTEFFARYMIGYETPWVPTASHTDPDGTPTVIYKQLSGAYRGRLSQNTWEPFYYYKYVKGINIEERAPYFTKMFAMRPGYNWDGVDGGGDFWLFIPPAAEAEGSKYLVKPHVNPIRELENRFSAFDANSVSMTEGTTSFVRVSATEAGSRLALVGSGYGTSLLAFRVRTNGTAVIEAFGDTITLPDTKGEWKYVPTPHGLSDLEYFTVKGAGTTVDIDHLHADAVTMTPPAFTAGNTDLSIFTYTASTETINYDFAATDATATDVVTYQIDRLPAGAVFNTSTGAFSWKPTQPGTYTFVVSATDGNTMTTRDIRIVVSADRQASVSAVTAAFNTNTIYISSTVAAYNSAYADAMNLIGTADDAVFTQKLAALNTAVQGLQVLTPRMSDGGVDYRKMLSSSTFGGAVGAALDDNPDSFVGYFQAVNLTHTLDFGADYRISPNGFQLQVRASFPERIGGVAIFGSDDNETWTRLTPGLSVVSDDMQTLPVQEDLKNLRFRFLKLQMIQPSSSMFELSEFKIFGERFEAVNEIGAVSLSSEQSLKNRVIAGDTVKLNFQSKRPISNVNVLIQGQPATVATADNLNWTASWVVPADATAGTIKFKLNYRTAEGIDAPATIFTTTGPSLFISDQRALMSSLLDIAALKDSSGRNAADLLSTVNVLFDKNLGSITDFRVNGGGAGAWLMFDFKEGGLATLSKVEVISRQDNTSGRINGTVVQGSNDASAWTTISNTAFNTADWQTLTINSTQPFRYIRMFNGNTWFGNMAELRLHGVATSTNKIATVSMSSAQNLRNRIVPGNTVKLSFTAKEAINNVSATIQGQAATVSTTDNINFTATATLNPGVEAGPVKFALNYKLQDGQTGLANTATTDNTSLYVVDESDVLKNLPAIATLIDSSHNRPMSTTVGQINNLGDGNLGSISDFRIGTNNSGTGSYITFDFKAGNQARLTSVELAPRPDNNFGRIKGTVVQGSNDNAEWTTLTPAAGSTQNWQTLAVASQVPYRYIRIVNGGNWFGNMSEVRFHGSVQGADLTPPVTTDNAPAGPLTQPTTVSFAATDASSGVATTYFKVNGGAQQTGNTISLTNTGSYSLSYWSVDWAGNVEQPHTVSVSIRPPDVSASVQMTQQGAIFNRSTGKYVGSVTITNTGGAPLTGPLQLKLSALTTGLTLDNASGSDGGAPYVTVAGTLSAGASIKVPLTFTNPNRTVVSYSPVLYKGTF